MKSFRQGLAAALGTGLLLLGTSAALAQEAPAQPVDPNVIPMQGNLFAPLEVTVPVGTTLTWVNLDPEAHNVIAADFTTFESPVLNTGEQWAFTFAAPGTYSYFCDLHANMTGLVTVVESLAPVAGAEAEAGA
jgi:plastocyanin